MKMLISRWKLPVILFMSLVVSLLVAPPAAYASSSSGPINWSTTVTISNTRNPAWGRMLPWNKHGENLITYTEYPSSGPFVIKVATVDKTAEHYHTISSIPSPDGYIQEQSQMAQLPDGTILMATRSRTTDLNWFGLPVFKSSDGGHTWKLLSQLDTNPNSAGRFNRGLWEPFLYVLPNGCVAGFYSSEKHADDNPSYNQVVSERVSCDGGATWGPEIFAAAQPGAARPGMPVMARMANGRYILVFELCATDNCNAHYKTSSDGVTWSNDLGTKIPDQYNGPYVTVLPGGRVVLTSAGSNQVSISDDNGATWYKNEQPAWNTGCCTWPAIYQVGNNPKEIGVVVGLNGALTMRLGRVK